MQEKRLYTIEPKKGLDLSSEATEIAPERASHMVNMLKEGGLNRKRRGWRVIKAFTDHSVPLKINGIFEYRGGEGSHLVVHAGTIFFTWDGVNEEIHRIRVEDGINVCDTKSQGFQYNDSLWLIAGDGVLCYDGEKISRLSFGDGYIPTTSVRNTVSTNQQSRIEYESPNILTPKRINMLRGESLKSSDTGELVYYLDSKFKNGGSVDIRIRLRVKTSEDEDAQSSLYIGVDGENNEVSTVVNVKMSRECVLENDIYFLIEPITDDNGDEIKIKLSKDAEVTEYTHLPFSFRITNGNELRLKIDCPPPELYTDNISVLFEAEGEGERILEKATLGALFTSSLGTPIIMLSSGDNRLYYSSPSSRELYFPESSYLCVGGSDKITAISPLPEGYVGVFKKSSYYRLSFSTERNDLSLYKTDYRIYQVSDTHGAINHGCVAQLLGDTVAFGEDGVYGDMSTVNNEATHTLHSRSSFISKLLLEHTALERENAVSCVFDGRYYLFIGDKMYACQPDEKAKAGTGVNDFEYEWWVCDDCPAFSLLSYNSKLYMAREDGRVAVFYDGYVDVDVTRASLSKSTLTFAQNDEAHKTVFTVSKSISLEDGDTASLSAHERLVAKNAFYKAADGKFYIKSDEMIRDGEVRIFDGLLATVYAFDGTLIAKGSIRDLSLTELSFGCELTEEINDAYSLFVYVSDNEQTEYTVLMENDSFTLLYEGEEIKIADTGELEIYITTKRNVRCELSTAVCDLGDCTRRKTLYGMYVKPSLSTLGQIEIGYETESSTVKRSVYFSEASDPDSLSFSRYSMKGRFARVKEISVFERDFNYIIFTISSSSDKDCAVEKIGCLYTANKRIKGGK